jgi:hypothetical protein
MDRGITVAEVTYRPSICVRASSCRRSARRCRARSARSAYGSGTAPSGRICRLESGDGITPTSEKDILRFKTNREGIASIATVLNAGACCGRSFTMPPFPSWESIPIVSDDQNLRAENVGFGN